MLFLTLYNRKVPDLARLFFVTAGTLGGHALRVGSCLRIITTLDFLFVFSFFFHLYMSKCAFIFVNGGNVFSW